MRRVEPADYTVEPLRRKPLAVETRRHSTPLGAGCDHVDVRSGVPAGAWAEQQLVPVRDDPAGRITLMERCYYGPFGKAPRHLPFRRAAMAFMRWQLQRGVLQPAFSDRPGSPWWRAVNERILRDGCEAVGLSGGLPGPASSRTVDYWMSFADYPIARAWYRAHNGSVVAAYPYRGVLIIGLTRMTGGVLTIVFRKVSRNTASGGRGRIRRPSLPRMPSAGGALNRMFSQVIGNRAAKDGGIFAASASPVLARRSPTTASRREASRAEGSRTRSRLEIRQFSVECG